MSQVQSANTTLTLLVAGHAPRSERARAHLHAILREIGRDVESVREIDLLQEPLLTIEYGIFATPALIREDAAGSRTILYGELSDTTGLRRFLLDSDG
ncbi:circadian clock KaiB family protein [Aquisalimonas lutea]|uniref:circadian clock KaiB family protein n=1 Tax=Aquisalimonas lutea TaxID=1327750 RepID=UPI0025B61DB0|nr:circadian clock KaiB family protein [Aquisalimonas lutea]MDN3519709.1 circadian clock KaiB family protein [Aquisalimonas lutea]